MLRVGLTGGIGCGKSTVCRIFKQLGASVIDTDTLAREAVEPGSAALRDLADHFGSGILHDDGTLDRKTLRERAFSDSRTLKQLEQILHPAIRRLLQRRLKQCTAPYVIIAIPLLLEKGWQDEVDRILVVDCSEAQQLARTCARDSNDEALVKRIIAQQVPRLTRLEAADDIIHNDAQPSALQSQVERLHADYTSLATSKRS